MRIFVTIILLSVCSLSVKVKKAPEQISAPKFLQSKFEQYLLAQLKSETAVAISNGDGGNSNDGSGKENSSSILGQGIEDTAGAIVDLGNQAEGVLHHQDEKVNTSMSASANANNAIMRDMISTKEREIRDIDIQIEELDKFLHGNNPECSSYSHCDLCTEVDQCVWCVGTAMCVAGDSNGPTNGECENFDWSRCTNSACSSLLHCDECIDRSDCAWCINATDSDEHENPEGGKCVT